MPSLGGIIAVGRSDSAYPLSGLLVGKDAIAAVIIGGTSFFGGKGNVLGTFCGVILISVLRNGGFKRVKRMKKEGEIKAVTV